MWSPKYLNVRWEQSQALWWHHPIGDLQEKIQPQGNWAFLMAQERYSFFDTVPKIYFFIVINSEIIICLLVSKGIQNSNILLYIIQNIAEFTPLFFISLSPILQMSYRFLPFWRIRGTLKYTVQHRHH